MDTMIGQTISHYRITDRLGAGGMGEVYRAEDQTLQRAVALKLLPADLTPDQRARERMLREARVASRLNHPHIATVYEVGETGDTPFIAMELVEGETLKSLLQRGAVPASQLRVLARQIADGLNEAHRAGVLHRDMKPGNIMIDRNQRAKILDFGLAVLARRDRTPDETAEGFVTRTLSQWSTGGTVPYMSPEQLRGDKTDARGDIFSYGILLYECLAGSRPFDGDTSVDIMHAILHQPVPPLRSVVPDIAPDWEGFIQRCLAKSPEQRFSSMQEVLDNFPGEATKKTTAEKSIAVLYFENLSGQKDEEYFRDGMTEDIITELSKIKELRVFPRSAVLAYRDKPVAPPQIGQELNTRYVLGGSVRRAGNRLRITAQLVETRTNHSVWADRYDRQLEDVFEIQDEIAQNIARELRVMLTEQEKRAIQKAPTANVQAYDYYLRGRQFFHQLRRKGFDYARQMFARAIVIDPTYARAYAGVADCCSFLYMLYHEGTEENLKEAESASKKALELDPELAEAHAARGLAESQGKRYDEALREFETAIRLDPNLYEPYYFCGRTYYAQGKLEEAAHWFEQAARVNPADYQAPGFLGGVYRALGREAEGEQANRHSLEVLQKHLEMQPDDARAVYFGAQAYSLMGENENAIRWADRALAIDAQEPTVLYNVACVYAVVGNTEKAIDCLEKSVAAGYGGTEWMKHDPDFDSLRDDPRFQALAG